MKKLYRLLVVIIIVLSVILAGLLIKQAVCDKPHDEAPPSSPGTEGFDVPVPSDMRSAQNTSAVSEPCITPNPYLNIPRSVTEGTLDEMFSRLEQFKYLPGEATLILLDVGHGGFDSGAIGSFTGVRESELTLEISRYLSDSLADMGYYVLMTRTGDYALARSKREDMDRRTEMLRLDIFDLCISIHINSFTKDPSVSGARIYHKKTGDEGERLAELIMQKISAALDQRYNPTVPGKDLMVIREPSVPAVLVECGFISNKTEEQKLCDPEYQRRLANAIAAGVKAFLNGETKQ